MLRISNYCIFVSPALELDDEEMRGGADSDFGPRGRSSVSLSMLVKSHCTINSSSVRLVTKCSAGFNSPYIFLATLVALHFTPVSE